MTSYRDLWERVAPEIREQVEREIREGLTGVIEREATDREWPISDRLAVRIIEGEAFSEGPRVLLTVDGDCVATGSGTPRRFEALISALESLGAGKPPIRIERNGDAFEVWAGTEALGLVRNARIIRLIGQLYERPDFWAPWKAAIDSNQALEAELAIAKEEISSLRAQIGTRDIRPFVPRAGEVQAVIDRDYELLAKCTVDGCSNRAAALFPMLVTEGPGGERFDPPRKLRIAWCEDHRPRATRIDFSIGAADDKGEP
jgi:hypothetical protein